MSTRYAGRVSGYLLAGVLLFGAAGVSIATGPSASASAKKIAPDTIVINNFMFAPMKLKVAPGATISVTNKDTVVHSVSAVDGKFNTGNISPNKTKTFKAPKKAGTYHYICAIHQFMTGTIVVK